MNKISFLLIGISFFAAAKGQTTYAEAIRQGDDASNSAQFKTAINKYFAAEAFDPSKKDFVIGIIVKCITVILCLLIFYDQDHPFHVFNLLSTVWRRWPI